MHKVDPHADHRIGPNAILQLAVTLRARLGEAETERVFATAGLTHMLVNPPTEMVDERDVAALHRALFILLPETAPSLADDAGRRTADYILANRIPRAAQFVLKLSPPLLAARLLLAAITKHAWTFAGSGRFRVHRGRPNVVEIGANPIAAGNGQWHRAVFERLFQTLVSSHAHVTTTACCAAGAHACRFEIDIAPARDRMP